MKGRIIINERCKGCDYCVNACTPKLIQKSDRPNVAGHYPAVFTDPAKKCTGCGVCYIVCPDAAIEVYKEVKEGEES